MNPVTAFRQRLLEANNAAFQMPLPDLSEEMAHTTRKLRTELGDISRGSVSEHGIAVAVIAYLKTRELPTYRDIKYVCFGASSPYGNPHKRIIEQDTLFSMLLAQVEALANEPRKLRRCYQGLLKAYFRYPGHRTDNPVGQKCWLALRDFLARHCEPLRRQQPLVEWTLALYEHRNLLGDNPCQRYGQALLAGDDSPIEELKTRLGIDDDTWIMNELILAQVQAATALPDQEFISQVMRLVGLLEPHPLLLTPGLAALLRRYARCVARPEHHTLRNAALREWKSPWLEANKPQWHGLVGDEATEMVSQWLKERSIRDFFELLQSNGQADRQRMEFWLQYAEAIDEIWLALGQDSLYNNKSDYKRIRQQMEGRYMALEGNNYHQDNAFLMRIGGYVLIEFGKQNNACHVFQADNLPFRFGQKSVLGTQEGLKNTHHPGHRARLMHREGWQWEFGNFLCEHAGAIPGESKPVQRTFSSANASAQVPTAPSRNAATAPTPAKAKAAPVSSGRLDMNQLRAFCAERGLAMEDHRPKGGALWVRGSNNEIVSPVLNRIGFRYKEGKGWWLASTD